MKKTKLEKGITLVALIITIVVLLILAVVSIGAVKNSGIIGHAQETASKNTVSQEKEQITLALNEWYLQKNTPNNITSFKSVVESALKDENVTIIGEEDGPLTVIYNKTGHQYLIYGDGTITSIEKGIHIIQSELTIKLGKTAQIDTTLLGGLNGIIKYSSSASNIASVDDNGVVSGLAEGKATITVTCEGYTTTCEVTVQELKIETKAYNASEVGGEGIMIVTSDNKLKIFRETSLFPVNDVDLTEGVGNFKVNLVGFSDTEKNELNFLRYEEMGMIFVLTEDRNICYIPTYDDNGNLTISKNDKVNHNDALLSQCYHNSDECEFYYGEWDSFKQSGDPTVEAGESVVKIDYTNNLLSLYNRNKYGANNNWVKNDINITNISYNQAEFSVTVDGKEEKITTSAKKIECSSICYYIQNGRIFQITGNTNTAELINGFDVKDIVTILNEGLLPTE